MREQNTGFTRILLTRNLFLADTFRSLQPDVSEHRAIRLPCSSDSSKGDLTAYHFVPCIGTRLDAGL